MKNLTELHDRLIEMSSSARTLGIMSHTNPDGDGFCASLALQSFLRERGIISEIVVDKLNLDKYAYLMQDNHLRLWDKDLAYQTMIVLDCNSLDRLGEREALVEKAERVLLIDHHLVEHRLIPAEYSFIDPSFASVGCIIFHTLHKDLESLPDKARIGIVSCLYTTILNDTNNFTNGNTDAEVFATSAAMTRLGIKPHLLHKHFFLDISPEEMRYNGEVLSTIELALDRRILFLYSTLDMLKRNNIDPETVMNVTRMVQGVKDIDAIVYLREEAPNAYKVSLRSPKLDVNRIACLYGGGGHRSASGAHINAPLEQIKAELTEHLREAIAELETNA